jgi:thymidylate synthase (FAD)
LSPSVVSQRYVDESFGEFVVPPELAEDDSLNHIVDAMRRLHAEARQLYTTTVAIMTDKGYSRKNARQAARAILPGGHATKIVITGNIRAWRHVIAMRFSVHADVEIREMARQILGHLRVVAPNQVQDIGDEPRV